MKKDEVLGLIKRLAESAKLLDQLIRIPKKEVDKALSLLSDPKEVEALQQLLRTIKELQSGRRLRGTSKKPTYSIEFEELGSVLANFLMDRQRFKTVTSISDFVMDVFKLDIPPHSGESRSRYITKVVRAINESPRALYHARNTLMHREPDPKDHAYMLLYNFIRGRTS